jgi:hypothetical protein
MKRCEFFETCEFSTSHAFGKNFADLPRIQSLADVQKIEHIDFATTLTEITQRQKERLNEQL